MLCPTQIVLIFARMHNSRKGQGSGGLSEVGYTMLPDDSVLKHTLIFFNYKSAKLILNVTKVYNSLAR